MQKLNIQNTQHALQSFDFERLFINELAWNYPTLAAFKNARPIAELSILTVFEIITDDIPEASTRKKIHHELTEIYPENILIFTDKRTKCVLYWGTRTQEYFRGQSGELFISKLSALFTEISELNENGDLPLTRMSVKLHDALDIEKVTNKFYLDFQKQHAIFLERIEGIDNERDRRWYTSIIINRLMFIWFLQKKGFLDAGDMDYLPKKLIQHQDDFYQKFLKILFFEGFATPKEQRSKQTNALLGDIR
ncbi:MAG: ATP-binding protein, partial [Thiomargarita sp.]|nr:ATP-binding protein [Thiomargarita sp.]